ncbi:energy transducer TonB [Granulicella sibirica]|uniref:TonB C-terminal domain-containing protein n=1 Tax=Granulicella sibirica TaxID=2479048 RepID=A0A4Q0T4C6_9BACT|nr:energy transducer TonB [Granulicella sibirica]RXH57400.1 hypothetical protein GRAN_0710 [Granulicella sibirica]
MRRVIAATLLLSPALLLAQAKTPASNASVLESKLVQPAELAASKSADTTTSKAQVRISKGVVAPKLVHSTNIPSEDSSFWTRNNLDRKFVVGMIVDETGKPSNLKIVASPDAEENRNVLDAVSQYRFTPGTVNDRPTAVPVSLEIVLKSQSGN